MFTLSYTHGGLACPLIPGCSWNISGRKWNAGYVSVGLSLVVCSGGMTASGWVSICTGGAFGSVDNADVGTIICGCKLICVTCAAELELGMSLGSGDCMSVASR